MTHPDTFPDLASQAELDAERFEETPAFPPREDAEFSDYGRSERFPPGWWIVPAALLSFGLAGLLAWFWILGG